MCCSVDCHTLEYLRLVLQHTTHPEPSLFADPQLLDVSDNRVQSLPENMEIMRHLTTLKLANNKIKRLPACLQPPYACVLLRPLELDGNPIMDPEADERGGGCSEARIYTRGGA